MACQSCGARVATKHVTFHQNIGAMFIRFTSRIDGWFCKGCVHKHFWTVTAINLTLGWWGVISMIVTPIFLVINLAGYFGCLFKPWSEENRDGSPLASVGARRPTSAASLTGPQLSDAAINQLTPYAEEMITRLQNGEHAAVIMHDVVQRTGLTPNEVAIYIGTVARALRVSAQ